MLVLTRNVNEPIYLTLEDGRRIAVVVAQIKGDSVRIGIDAPATIAVTRHDAKKGAA